ncbi:helix-turn-helix transcriptional regulator [Gryllotalpicola daejeonensis]
MAPGQKTAARNELGSFLRSRRERITPDQVGLPAGGRRRTPGLRREEVAMLAGVGVTWYTWLEQGRDISPSPGVLDAIARALRLDSDEREHLWLLAVGRGAGEPDPSGGVVTEGHLALLAGLMPTPACIQTDKFDILASNASYRFLIDDLDKGSVADRNCMVRAFLDPVWAAAYPDYEEATARMVARLRSALPRHLDDPSWTALVERMRTESPRFRKLWQQREVVTSTAPQQVFRSRRVGTVRVHFIRLWLENTPSVRLISMQPVTAADARRLARLAELVADEPVVTTRPSVAAQLPVLAA